VRIGFDVDGVLADFIPAYQALFVLIAGKNLFEPGDIFDPPCWHWPTLRGYEDQFPGITMDVLRNIWSNDNFWYSLGAMKNNVRALNMLIPLLEEKHEVYFLTNRAGLNPKRQTEMWLYKHLGYGRMSGMWPTVLICGENAKGDLCKHLKLDAYLDDKLENVEDVIAKNPTTQTYLLTRAYNQHRPFALQVKTLGEFLDAEMANL
jgi:hypothetical protein